MTEQEPLKNDLIENPQLWRLSMKVLPDRLDVLLYSTIEEGGLIRRSFPYDESIPTKVRAIQEVVYANPLLTSPFERVDVVLVEPTFTTVPMELADEETAFAILSELYPQNKMIDNLVINHMPRLGASIIMAPNRELVAFFRRTFDNPTLYHPLAVLTNYFHSKNRQGNTRKLFVHLDGDHVNVMAFTRDNLRLANTFRIHEPADAAYYIISVRDTLEMSPYEDEILIAGDISMREKVMPILRKYNSFVMPVIFPSAMFKAGKDAMSAPFELIVLPLCE